MGTTAPPLKCSDFKASSMRISAIAPVVKSSGIAVVRRDGVRWKGKLREKNDCTSLVYVEKEI